MLLSLYIGRWSHFLPFLFRLLGKSLSKFISYRLLSASYLNEKNEKGLGSNMKMVTARSCIESVISITVDTDELCNVESRCLGVT